MQTGLLKQSPSAGRQLQAAAELQQTNEQLAPRRSGRAERRGRTQNQEIEQARARSREAELALTSKCKSEFLANMSHDCARR
jgi:signal transduction histidine kinase